MYYQLYIEIMGIEPKIWRRFIVPSNITLDSLNDVIQIVMGWTNYHQHEFIIQNRSYLSFPESSHDGLDEAEYKIEELIDKKEHSFIYMYDFGDEWFHNIILEKTFNNLPEEAYLNICCMAGARNCPPENMSYEILCEVLKDKKHPFYDECIDQLKDSFWYNEQYDPEYFDPKKVNLILNYYGYWNMDRTKTIPLTRN